MVISLAAIVETIGAADEHPLARHIWNRIAMQRWREEWRRAEADGDYHKLDSLDRSYELIQAV